MKNQLWLLIVGYSCTYGRAAELETALVPRPTTVPVVLTTQVLQEWTDVMKSNHPALRAQSFRRDAGKAVVAGVRTWEDPRFRMGGSTASPRGFKEREEGNLLYGAEQKLPLFGKVKAAREAAETGVVIEQTRWEALFQALRRDLTKALFQLAGWQQALSIGSEDLGWLSTLTSTLDDRFRSGVATQVEWLRLQNEHSKRQEQLHTIGHRRDHAFASVRRLVNQETAPSHSGSGPVFDLPPVAPPLPASSNLIALALKFEPRWRILQSEIRQAEAQVTMTHRSRLPDVTFGIDGRQYSGDGGFREGTFTLGINIPWFNRRQYRADIARDEARLHAIEWDAVDSQLGTRDILDHWMVDVEAARREAVLLHDVIIPRAEQAIQAARANWSAGRGLFLELMDARRSLLEAEDAYARAVVAQQLGIADIVYACGFSDADAFEGLRTSDRSSLSIPTP